MSKTFTYALAVICVYLFMIKPKKGSTSKVEEKPTKETTNKIKEGANAVQEGANLAYSVGYTV